MGKNIAAACRTWKLAEIVRAEDAAYAATAAALAGGDAEKAACRAAWAAVAEMRAAVAALDGVAS